MKPYHSGSIALMSSSQIEEALRLKGRPDLADEFVISQKRRAKERRKMERKFKRLEKLGF